ncbi:isochorismatase family cysteine hydrolase [Patulibacter sp. NPDC049589]|uniref:cysteine hydrolase family protein n=1 Tax=Patulibacter sp. NPDC049589 TaxID=3154731 RepID=UPI00342ACAC2
MDPGSHISPAADATREVDARPYPYRFAPATTALVIIDMQRDFLEPGGFGETLGNDVSLLASAIGPVGDLLAAARRTGMLVVHTREGHRPDLGDLPASKRSRGNPTLRIGDLGPRGRILVRGEEGHDVVDELAPIAGEPVLDKPGKGAFYATDFELLLRTAGITHLIVCGVTTEVCVHTTVREANDRGFECVVVEDGTGSYFPEFHEMALRMIAAQNGIFGWTATSQELLAGIEPATATPPAATSAAPATPITTEV